MARRAADHLAGHAPFAHKERIRALTELGRRHHTRIAIAFRLTMSFGRYMVNMTTSRKGLRPMPQPRRELPARIPGLQSRDEFLKLVGLEVEAFNSLRRRRQLPIVPPLDMPEEWVNAGGWSPLTALALNMALALTERYRLSRTRAAEIARYVFAVPKRWADISRTSLQLANGNEPDFHVLFASLDLAGVKPTKRDPDPIIAVGTLTEIAAEYPTATSIIAVSVTQCAALMRQRAQRAKIDLGDFW